MGTGNSVYSPEVELWCSMTSLSQSAAAPPPRPSARISVFVYGTLKPGEFYYPQYCEGKCVEAREARVKGQLFDLPFGYPAMTEGEGVVYGYLFQFADEQILRDLDELEDYDPTRSTDANEYQRVAVEVCDLSGGAIGRAWTYVMSAERVRRSGGVFLADGVWTGQRTQPTPPEH